MRSVLARSATVAVLTVGLVGAGCWIPTQSRDEAATLSAVQRSWPQLWAMLERVDIVHGLYYAAMKGWLELVGTSTLTLRLPSVLACGLAAGLVVVLGSLLANPRAGLLAGLVLAVAPRITRIAVEGRSAALFTAVAVLLVLLVVVAVRRPSIWLVPPLALVTAVLGALHIYTLLLLPVLGLYLLYAWRRAEPDGSRWKRWRTALAVVWPLLAIAAGAVPVLWLALQARTQQAQVDWIDPPSLQTLAGMATEPFSPRNSLWAVLAWAAAAAGLVWLTRHHRRHRGTVLLLVGWVTFPGLALILLSAVWSPLYSHRYLAFCVPPLALLAGMGLASVRRWLLSWLVVTALVLSSLVTYREQRNVDAWDNWQQIMGVLAYRGQPGDVVMDYPLVSAMAVSYPDAYAGMPVINAGADRLRQRHLWDERLPLAEVEWRLVGVQRLWYLTPLDDDVRRTSEIQRLRRLGFSGEMLERGPSEQTWLFTRSLAEAQRGDLLLRTPG